MVSWEKKNLTLQDLTKPCCARMDAFYVTFVKWCDSEAAGWKKIHFDPSHFLKMGVCVREKTAEISQQTRTGSTKTPTTSVR